MQQYIVNNGSVQDVICTLKNIDDNIELSEILLNIDYESKNKNRSTVLKKLNAIKNRKLKKQ